MDITTKAVAKQQGYKYFFTGKKCKNGHISKRVTTSGSCKECAAIKYHMHCYQEYLNSFSEADLNVLERIHPKIAEYHKTFDANPLYAENARKRAFYKK